MLNYRKYISNNDFDKKWDFYVTTVGSASVKANKCYPNNSEHPIDHSLTWQKGRILNGYYIVFISKGEGVLETAQTNALHVKAGTCFFLFPGVWHRYKPNAQRGWEEYWIGFNGDYPAALIRNGLFCADNPFIDVGLNEELLALFHLIIKTVSLADPGYQQVAIGIILQILGVVSAASKYQSDATDAETRLISKAKFILQETIDKPVNLEEMVKELPMGYSNFRKAFKKICGISPNQYHLNLRLDRAKELLATTNLTVNQIAFHTGFDSIFYFSRLFKKKNGIAPKAYREENFN